MTSIALSVVVEARRWLGTPYLHQASECGVGADCLGLLRGVWRGVIGPEPFFMPSYSRDWSEPQGREDLWAAAQAVLIERDMEANTEGDVLLFRMRDGAVAKHLGIATARANRPGFVHAYSGHGVVESALSAPWKRRIVARFSSPERM